MAAVPVSDIEAVVFDLFGTLVYEFPRADWEGWLETSAAILEADVDAFKGAWQATGIERQTGRLGDLEENLRTVAARAGAWPTDAQLTEILDGRAAMYRKWFVPRPGAEQILGRLRGDGYRLGLISMCAPDAPAISRVQESRLASLTAARSGSELPSSKLTPDADEMPCSVSRSAWRTNSM